MTDSMPEFPPLPLSGLTYAQAKQQMRETGLAARRPHWCSPVLVWDNGRVWFDDDGITSVWVTAPEDMHATDWMTVERPA